MKAVIEIRVFTNFWICSAIKKLTKNLVFFKSLVKLKSSITLVI